MNALALAKLLDKELCLKAFRDVSNNGLQIENDGEITSIATAVDVSLETFEVAVAQGAQMLLVHHGLSWGNSLAYITGLNRKLIAYALAHNLAVYAAHLPLDAHPTLGNNAQIAQAMGLHAIEPFMDYHGQKIGFKGLLPQAVTREAFCTSVQTIICPSRIECFEYGKERIQSVGICSGGAPEGIEEAAREGLDVYLCGEANLIAYNLAKQLEMNAYFAGHYATERLGIRALGEWVRTQTGLSVDFIDFHLPY